jgi:Meiotically up-regulated gene 113
MITIKNYWRISPTALPTGFSPFTDEWLPAPSNLLHRLQPGEGVAYADWNEEEMIGQVRALGVCLDKGERGARMDWREVQITLKPLPAGRTHWKKKEFFGFAASVTQRYGLADLFAERFPDLDQISFSSRKPATGVSRRLSPQATPGYVYLLRSEYGFKIGKTVSMKSRTRLFEVKLPFRFSVEHFAHFENYSQAERDLHQHFRGQRLEGEWFDLRPPDITHIKSLGRPGRPGEMRV